MLHFTCSIKAKSWGRCRSHEGDSNFGITPKGLSVPEPGRSCWSLLPTVWGAGYSASYTNVAQVTPTWLSLGLTAVLELPQRCTELKNLLFVHPCSLHQQSPWSSGEGRKPRFNISVSPCSSLVRMLRTNNKIYHAPMTTSWQTMV